jgi:hypothetical protein
VCATPGLTGSLHQNTHVASQKLNVQVSIGVAMIDGISQTIEGIINPVIKLSRSGKKIEVTADGTVD